LIQGDVKTFFQDFAQILERIILILCIDLSEEFYCHFLDTDKTDEIVTLDSGYCHLLMLILQYLSYDIGLSCDHCIDSCNKNEPTTLCLQNSLCLNICYLHWFTFINFFKISLLASLALNSHYQSIHKQISWCSSLKLNILFSFDIIITCSLDMEKRFKKYKIESDIDFIFCNWGINITDDKVNFIMLALGYTSNTNVIFTPRSRFLLVRILNSWISKKSHLNFTRMSIMNANSITNVYRIILLNRILRLKYHPDS